MKKAAIVKACFDGQTTPGSSPVGLSGSEVDHRGLVLDELLHQVASARRSLNLSRPNFDLKDMGSYPGAPRSIEIIVRDSVAWHNGEVFVRPCPLLGNLGEKIYGEQIDTASYSGQRISSASVEPVLRRVLELGLQTLVQLPSRDATTKYSAKKILSRAATLIKYGAQVSGTLREGELQGRAQFILREDPASCSRLMQVGEEMRWAGKMLQTIAKAKLRRLRLDSPNPQVRFALYLAGWIRSCTGKPRYALLKTLMQAAFHSAGKRIPKWGVERLEIEMNLKMKHRKEWAQTITS